MAQVSPHISDACFSPDAGLLAGTESKAIKGKYRVEIRVLDTRTGRLLKSIRSQSELLTGPTFWPTSRTLTALTSNGLKQWDVRTGKLLRRLPMPNGYELLALSPDRKHFATASEDSLPGSRRKPKYGGIRLYNIQTRKLVRVFQGGRFNQVLAFSPDGRVLAAGSEPVELLELKAHGARRIMHLPQHSTYLSSNGPSWLSSLAFSPDGSTIAGGEGENARAALLNARTGKLLWILPERQTGEFDGVHRVTFSPDGRLLAVVNDNGTVRLWRLR